MIKKDKSKKYLLQGNLDESKIKELTDTLTVIVKEIIKNNIENYEKSKCK
jgi:hypothetical protein